MNKLVSLTAALVAALATVAVAVPASAAETCPKDWGKCSIEQKLDIARTVCGADGFNTRDVRVMKLETADRAQFLQKVGCIEDARAVPPPAADDEDDRPKPVGYRKRGERYDSFDNVAEGSLRVRTRRGKNYELGNLRGNPDSCQPPMKWHKTDFCKPIARGGITCKMACR